MKELGPAWVEGAGNPPAVASRRAPHIWATGTAAPRRWGGGRSAPDTQPFPERGVVAASLGKSGGPRRGCESWYLSVVSGLRHRVCLWVREVPQCAHQCSVRKHPPPTPSPAGPVSWGRLQLFLGLLCPWPFWEMGDSCYYKARDSWVAGDSWMGLAYPCIQTAQAPPGHTPGSWLLRP